MNKSNRTILFVICLFLFGISAPIIILFSSGYRVDLKAKRLTQVGGLYFRTQPKNADIDINGYSRKQSDILFGTIFIENIFPKTYQVSVSKNNYFPWKKSLTVEPKKVTEAKNITLISKKINAEKIENNLARIYRSPKGNRIFLEKYQSGTQYFVFINDNENRQEIVSSKELFGEKQIYLHQLTFSENEQLAIAKVIITNSNNPQRYYLLEFYPNSKLLTAPTTKTINKIPINETNIGFGPNNSRQLYFISNNDLWSFVPGDNEPKKIQSGIKAFTFNRNNLYYLDAKGYLYKSDENVSYRERINDNPFILKEDNVYEILAYESFLMIKDNASLFRFSRERKQFEKIFNQVSDIRLSPDGKKIAIISGTEIWIMYLADNYDAPYRRAGDLVFLTRLSGEIKPIYWFTGHYLIFCFNDTIKVIEIDDRDLINVAEPEFYYKENRINLKNIDAIYNENTKRMYFLSENILYLIEKMID